MAIIRICFFLAAVNLLFNNISGLSLELSRFSGAVLFFTWLSLFFSCRFEFSEDSQTNHNLDKSRTSNEPDQSCTEIFYSDPGYTGRKQELLVVFVTILLYSLFYIYYQHTPYLWYFLQSFSIFFSKIVLSAAMNAQTLGQSAIGIQISLTFLCYFLTLLLLVETGAKKGRFYIVCAFFSVIAATIVWLFLQKPLTSLVLWFGKDFKPTSFDFQAVLLFLNFAVVSVFTQKIKLRNFSKKSIMWFAGLAVIILFASGSMLLFHLDTLDHGDKKSFKNNKIIFCDKGAAWSFPYYGKRYGQHSMGMFGILPEYLKMRGYSVLLTKHDVNEKMLQNAGALVVINPRYLFTPEEKKAVYSFIKNGGSLLAAGDHTDVAGTMKPINNLIEPFNITLNFDTALPFNSGWEDSLEIRLHPVTKNIKNDYDTSIWVGASLKIRLPAKPLIIGKLGWSDKGNYKNRKRAFLGDYKRDKDELLGDVVLAAVSQYGKGRILVFGDTSSFQNGTIPGTHPFINDIFKWLLPGTDAGFASDKTILSPRQKSLLQGTDADQLHSEKLAYNLAYNSDTSRYKPAFIDTYHAGKFSGYSPEDNSLWGLVNNLMRNRYIPLYMNIFSKEILFEASLLIVIAPTKAYTEQEILAIREFMEKGGIVIWSVGWEDMEKSALFLKKSGFDIDAVPLGPGKVKTKLGNVNFVEAWPVISDPDTSAAKLSVLASKFKYPVIVETSVKKGKLILIGDSSFLLSKNIETYKKYNMDNIRFFRKLIKRIKRIEE